MKRKVRWIVLAAAVILLVGLSALAYLKLEPSRHFRPGELPVLVSPTSQSESTGKGQGSNGGAAMDEKTQPYQLQLGTSDIGQLSKARKLTGFNLLLIGIDAREKENSRTDVLMLIHVDPGGKKVRMLSIPRDTRVQLPGIGYTKINHAHMLGEQNGGAHAGTQAALQAVSNLCGCTINYYVKIDFAGFERFVDRIGGVNLELSEPVKLTYAHRTIASGPVHLKGADTLDFVRERKSLAEGDSGRQKNQAMVLEAIVRQLLKPKNLMQISSLIDQVRSDLLDTNLKDGDILSLAWLAKSLSGENVQYLQLPGKGGRALDPLVHKELYYWVPDQVKWQELQPQFLNP